MIPLIMSYKLDYEISPTQLLTNTKSFSLEDFGTDAVKNGTHAWQLAKQINGEINRRPGTLKKGIMHLFIAGPHSLMFYLGMQSMMYGKIQIYEFNRNENTYYPTISFPQKGEL